MNNLKDLQAERQKLQLKEKALKQILVQQTQSAIDHSKRQIVERINSFSNWGQLGISALAIYQTFSHRGDEVQATSSPGNTQGLSDWLALASDFASVVE